MEEKLNQSGKPSKGSKMTIQNYIRLFEPLVIKSLKLYTITSSVELQVKTLFPCLSSLFSIDMYCFILVCLFIS